MRPRPAFLFLTVLAVTSAFVSQNLLSQGAGNRIKIPRIEGPYIHVYQPVGDVFTGPGTAELLPGEYYEEWVPNDHCFVRDSAGRWHAFGHDCPKQSGIA
jgi:hypothetical protein